MKSYLNLDRFPIDRPDDESYRELVARCRSDLEQHGMFNLDGLVKADALVEAVAALTPKMASQSFTHQCSHNVYFKTNVEGLPADHPALVKFESVNHTLCADQLAGFTGDRHERFEDCCNLETEGITG